MHNSKIKDKTPTVSVIFPVYNAAEFLKESIDSILNQTFQDFEIIAVDDGSTDNSLSILINYSRKFSNFYVIENGYNYGNSYSLNQAIKLAKGKFIVRMDADDRIHLKKFEKQVTFLNKHLDVDVVGCSYNRVNKDGKIVFRKVLPEKHIQIIKMLNLRKFFLSGPNFEITDGTIMARSSWFKKWKYNPRIFYAQDFDLICRSFLYSKFANLSEILYDYRIGSGITANLKAQLIACSVKRKAINSLPKQRLNFKYKLLLNLSLLLRPFFYTVIILYHKIVNQ